MYIYIYVHIHTTNKDQQVRNVWVNLGMHRFVQQRGNLHPAHGRSNRNDIRVPLDGLGKTPQPSRAVGPATTKSMAWAWNE